MTEENQVQKDLIKSKFKKPNDFLKVLFDKEDKFFVTTIDEKSGFTNNYLTDINNMDKFQFNLRDKNQDKENPKHIYYSVSTFNPYAAEKQEVQDKYQLLTSKLSHNDITEEESKELKQIEEDYYNVKNKEFSDFKFNKKQDWKSMNYQRKKDNVKEMKNIFFDFDEVEKVPEQMKKIREVLGEPTFTVESSSGKRQVIYKLEKGIEGSRQKEFEDLMFVLNDKVDSDVQVKTVQQILRLPYYQNIKSKYEQEDGTFPKAKIISYSENKVDYENLIELYKEDMENVSELKKEKSKGQSLMSRSISKDTDIHKFKRIDFKNYWKYNNIYKRVKSYRSTDLRYAKRRAQDKEVDFIKVWSEIRAFRKKDGNPFEETSMNTDEKLRKFYDSCLNIFLDKRTELGLDNEEVMKSINSDWVKDKEFEENERKVKQKFEEEGSYESKKDFTKNDNEVLGEGDFGKPREGEKTVKMSYDEIISKRLEGSKIGSENKNDNDIKKYNKDMEDLDSMISDRKKDYESKDKESTNNTPTYKSPSR